MIWQERAKGGYPDRSFLALPGEQRMGAARRGLIPYSPMGYLTELGMTEGSRGHSTFSMPASPWFANSSGLISGGVLAVIGAANRDEQRYDDPDRFDIERDPQPHISFGFGPHLCLGLHLARTEMRVALEQLLLRLPDIRLDDTDAHIEGIVFRSPTQLPVVW